MVKDREVPSAFNIEVTSLTEPIGWEREQVTEPVFTSTLGDVHCRASVSLPWRLQTNASTPSLARGLSNR